MPCSHVWHASCMRAWRTMRARTTPWTHVHAVPMRPMRPTPCRRDLYRVLMGSLRRSSAHFRALTLETLALGWAGLSKSHSGVWDEVGGEAWGLERREELQELLHALRWVPGGGGFR